MAQARIGVGMQTERPVLRVLESRSADDTLVLSVQGEIDLATVDTLAMHLHHVCDRADAVTVDLRRVAFLDCLGLRQLLCLHEDGIASGCRVGFIQGPPAVRRVFEMTGTLATLSFSDAAALQPAALHA
jgi:anti-sigma B factor antagonist